MSAAFVALDRAVAAALDEDPDLVLTALADYLIRTAVGTLASRGMDPHLPVMLTGEGFTRYVLISEEGAKPCETN